MTHRALNRAPVVAIAILLGVLSACSSEPQGTNTDPDQVDSTAVPDLGACRMLTPDDVDQPANATETVACTEKHTAQTFAVGALPAQIDDKDYDDPGLGEFAFETCSEEFAGFLGADESLVLRTIVSWAWFRPSEKAWTKGARWYRCDVVGGSANAESYRALPETAEGLLVGRPDDRWLVCAKGTSVAEGEKVPCSEDHDWRAVTTIKLGEEDDPYPGDRLVEVQSRDFCSRSVRAWLNYPAKYQFGYTYFHEAEWNGGNRRSVCWAQTDE
jgi:hypothetical protein